MTGDSYPWLFRPTEAMLSTRKGFSPSSFDVSLAPMPGDTSFLERTNVSACSTPTPDGEGVLQVRAHVHTCTLHSSLDPIPPTLPRRSLLLTVPSPYTFSFPSLPSFL